MTSWARGAVPPRAPARGSPHAASGWPGTATPGLRGAWNAQRNGRPDDGSRDGIVARGGAMVGGAAAPLADTEERAAQEILAAFALRRLAPSSTPARATRSGGFRAIFAAMNATIVRLDAPLEPDVSAPAADRVLAGSPEHRVWNYFTDSTQTFFAGRWSGTRGKWRVRYTENELCVMTAGRVVITSELGERNAFGPGDAFVIPAGFSGIWEVLEDCAKVYAIFEPRA